MPLNEADTCRKNVFHKTIDGAPYYPMSKVPPLDRQRWFNHLQRQTQQAETLRSSAAKDVATLLPAMLDVMFST